MSQVHSIHNTVCGDYSTVVSIINSVYDRYVNKVMNIEEKRTGFGGTGRAFEGIEGILKDIRKYIDVLYDIRYK